MLVNSKRELGQMTTLLSMICTERSSLTLGSKPLVAAACCYCDASKRVWNHKPVM